MRLGRQIVNEQGAHKLEQLLRQQRLARRANTKGEPIRHSADFLGEPSRPGATGGLLGSGSKRTRATMLTSYKPRSHGVRLSLQSKRRSLSSIPTQQPLHRPMPLRSSRHIFSPGLPLLHSFSILPLPNCNGRLRPIGQPNFFFSGDSRQTRHV